MSSQQVSNAHIFGPHAPFFGAMSRSANLNRHDVGPTKGATHDRPT